jgi:hypothetical protein
MLKGSSLLKIWSSSDSWLLYILIPKKLNSIRALTSFLLILPKLLFERFEFLLQLHSIKPRELSLPLNGIEVLRQRIALPSEFGLHVDLMVFEMLFHLDVMLRNCQDLIQRLDVFGPELVHRWEKGPALWHERGGVLRRRSSRTCSFGV